MENILITPDYRLRPFTLDDAVETTKMLNACSLKKYGYEEHSLEHNLIDWTSPGLNLEECTRVLVTADDTIAGYVEVWDNEAPHVLKFIWLELHPDHWSDHLAHWMLEWAEEKARERVDLAPQGTHVVMSYGIRQDELQHRDILTASGFNLIRSYYRMEMELTGQPTKPHLPDGVVIKPIDYPRQLPDAIRASVDAFKDHWGVVQKSFDDVLASWQHQLEGNPDFDPALWFLAMAGEEIAGICFCWPRIPEDNNMGWVAQLAVRRPWRKQGLGLALLQHAFNQFYLFDKNKAGLAVDANSLTDATRLYKKAGMHISRQFDTYHKELRSGTDLMTQAL